MSGYAENDDSGLDPGRRPLTFTCLKQGPTFSLPTLHSRTGVDNPEKGKTYAQTLLDVHAYARAAGIPFRHVQLDSWWYVKGAGGGTKSWTPGQYLSPTLLLVRELHPPTSCGTIIMFRAVCSPAN